MGIEDIVVQRSPAVHVKPSEEDATFISDCKAYLVVRNAFFAHLLYNEMVITFVDDDSGIPVAATDSYYIFVNVPGLRARVATTIPQGAFVLAHEILHKVLGHLVLNAIWSDGDGTNETVDCGNGVFLPYDHDIMNKAKDYIINAILIDGHVGEFPQGKGLYDPNLSIRGMESCVEVYEKLYKRARGLGLGPGGKPGDQASPTGHGGFDIHLPPQQQQIDEVTSGRNDQAIAAAAAAAEAAGQGNMPAALRKILGDILEPHVPWQEHLKSTIIRSAGDPAYDFRRIDRHLIVRPDPVYFAPLAHMGAGHVVIGYDTSGSCINPEYQQRFFSEMAGIVADLNPQKLTVIWCDATVQRVDEIEEPEDLVELHADINELGGAPGGGGTDFRPVFNHIEENELEPDILVYLTDMYGSFPSHEPDYPVVWASVTKGYKGHPWGDMVEVEL